MRKALKAALLLLQALTDEEQDVLSSWFESGGRRVLWESGIPDDVIGPHRAIVDYSAGDFVEDVVPAREPPARAEFIAAVQAFKCLNDNELGALRIWFAQESRACLYKAGATDEDIGPIRNVPDLAREPG